MAEIHCTVVTPEATTLDQRAEFVVVPLFDGELGIAPGHSPAIGRLGFGEMRLRTGEKVSRYYVDGGFVQIADDKVTVLTNRAVPATELDAEAAQTLLTDSLTKPANTSELMEIRDRSIEQARAQMRVARHR